MGYSWTPINKGDIIRASHFNEIKTHLEELYQDLELDAPNWTYFPVSVGEVILRDHIQELRDKTDYADDMNYCREYQSGYLDSVENNEEVNDHGTYNKTYKGSEKHNHHGTYDSSVHSDYDSGYNSGTKVNECDINRTTNHASVYVADKYDHTGSTFSVFATHVKDVYDITVKDNENNAVWTSDT